MATKTEESTLEKIDKELAQFIQEKSEAEIALKVELGKAETEYKALIKEIFAKYNVSELVEKIKRHTYVSKLIKGEVAFPEDLEASRRKVKSTQAKAGSRVKGWNEKIVAALSKIDKSISDNPTPKEVKAALSELYPDLQFEAGTFNAAWTKYKADNK